MTITDSPRPLWTREHYLCLTTLLEGQKNTPVPLPVAHKIRRLLPAVLAALEAIAPPQSYLLSWFVVSDWLSLRQLEVLYQLAMETPAPRWVTDSLAIYLISSENRGDAHGQLPAALEEYGLDFDILHSRLRPLPGDALLLEMTP